MNIHLLIIYVISLCLAVMALSAEPVNRSAAFDALDHFTVQVDVPAGSRHAVLEISGDLSPTANWRPMIAGAIDGRAAQLMFRLPPQAGGKVFARVKTGTATELPPVELSGEGLFYVTYADRISSRAKLDFLTAASPKMKEWQSLPIEQWQANVSAWAMQSPLVRSTEIIPPADNISVTFTDGTTATLLAAPRRYNGPSIETADTMSPGKSMPAAGGPVVAMGAPAHSPRAAGETTGHNLPSTDNAITAFSLESTFPNSAPTIGGWLSSRNYSVTNHMSTTVQQILNWSRAKPIAVLFWQSHGVPYRKKDGSIGISLVTYQEATDVLNEGPFKSMIEDSELVFSADAENKPYYSITSEFVRKRLRFADNSLVLIDACYGGGEELAQGFIDANAGSYGSWSWLSGPQSGTPFLKIFDRLLGMNEEPPVSTPKERPFALGTIRWWMSAFEYDYDPSPKFPKQTHPNAKLLWKHHETKPAYILRPTIMRVIHEGKDVTEPYTKFLIEGDFGDDPGDALYEVRWGGQKMNVVRWEPFSGITIRMPSSPPVGNIEVIMRKNFTTRSNVVPITEWTVPFTYELRSHGALTAKLEMNVKFRADIRGSRGNPEMPLQYLPRMFANMEDCHGTVSATGTYKPDASTTFTWSGGSNLSSVDPETEETYMPKRIRNRGMLDFGAGRMSQFQLTGDGTFTETEVRVHPDGTSTTIVRENGIAFPGFYPLPEMPVNPGSAVFRGNTLTWIGGTGSASLSWPSVAPRMAPDENTER